MISSQNLSFNSFQISRGLLIGLNNIINAKNSLQLFECKLNNDSFYNI